jgi:hypothetical protein
MYSNPTSQDKINMQWDLNKEAVGIFGFGSAIQLKDERMLDTTIILTW